MALKFTLAKAAYDKLSDDLKSEYTEKDGKYVLEIDGLPEPEDSGALSRAKAREKIRADEAEAEAERLQGELDNVRKNQGKGEKDVEKLTKNHAKEIAELTAAHDATVNGLKEFINTEVVGSKADAVANKISTSPKLMRDHVAKRITVDYSGDKPAIQYLGDDGKPDSKLDLDKLGENLVANKDFSAIIIATKAKGSGAAPGTIPGSVGSANPGDKPANLMEASTPDLVAHLKSVQAAKAQA